MTRYTIGIDTGGTYTDAVLMETASRRLLRWSKEATTHHDLGIGVDRALRGLFREGVRPEEIGRLSVSTTLATNAVVEGRGARVGLFVLGIVRHFKLPVVANVFLKGGHDITGREEQPLDIEGLVDTVQGLKNEVDAYAVCGAMAIRNPTHELVAEKAIAMIDPKPVFCSHRVSDHPGMKERAATACLHARLMPMMENFLASIRSSMDRLGLACPVTLICGNGQGTGLEEAVQRAAVTMASGPAATARFGASTGIGSALVVDVGGTTTDVCMLRDGQPVMRREGCRIGPWQTHVEAIDMYTAAGGGDSHVVCDSRGNLRLEKTRVQPLAMTRDLPDPGRWLGSGLRATLVLPTADDTGQDESDNLLRWLRQHGPATPATLAEQTGVSGIVLEKRLERLAYRQEIILAGFTPTDALHVLGRLDIGSREQAEAGAGVLAAIPGMSPEAFCRQVLDRTEEAIEAIIIDYLGQAIWEDLQAVPFLNRRDNALFRMEFALKMPLIGIGAASRCFLPGVARRLHTTVSFPDHYQVGNAMGAALISAPS